MIYPCGRCSRPVPSFCAGIIRRMEDAMTPFARLVPVVTGLVMLLNITPSWGQTPVCVAPGCNPTVSDAYSNTAGGTGTLQSLNPVFGGQNNTAFGSQALSHTSDGEANTAIGREALYSNFGAYADAETFCQRFFPWYNLEHRTSPAPSA